MIALIPDGFEEAYINQHIALARSVSAINASYVAWFLASREGGQRQFLRLQRGATKMGLGLDDICAVNLPIAPLPEQHRIIQEIERHFSVADEIEKIVEQSLNQTERLRQSVLKRAFQGKLVPQDPDEEPAEKLLERIKAERARQQASYMATGDRNRRNSGQGRL
jgi:type I restriction enzyme S subunit